MANGGRVRRGGGKEEVVERGGGARRRRCGEAVRAAGAAWHSFMHGMRMQRCNALQ